MSSCDIETGLNIVVVEDHDALRGLICQALKQCGHRATGVGCAEALQDLRDTGSVDIFLLDLNLPGEDGLSLAKRLRAASPLVGIIMATAMTSTEDRVEGYSSGADIYLPKPFEVSELCAVVASLGRRRSKERLARKEETTEPSAMLMDQRSLTLTGPQESVMLSAAEAQMLAAFARAPANRLEHWQLIEACGFTPATYPKSSLEVRIVRLRKKLIQAGAPIGCIEPVRREGYQLCAPISLR